MPIYEYECPACHATFEELIRSAGDEERVRCPKCGQRKVARRPSVFSAHGAPAKRSAPRGGSPACGQCCSPDGACPLAE